MDATSNDLNKAGPQQGHPSMEEVLFDRALRGMSMEAFRVVVEHGVWDVVEFLTLSKDQIREMSGAAHELANEIMAARNHILLEMNSRGVTPRQLISTGSREAERRETTEACAPEPTPKSASPIEASLASESCRPKGNPRYHWERKCGPSQSANRVVCLREGQGEATRASVETGVEAALASTDPIGKEDPIPASVLCELSTRARNVLVRHRISGVAQLLALSEAELRSLRNVGGKTGDELTQLQNELRQCLAQPGYRRNRSRRARGESENVDSPLHAYRRDPWEPEDWSVLKKPLRTFCASRSRQTEQALHCQSVADLGLSERDLEALRSIAVFPHDTLDDLHALAFGILAEIGISDSGFSRLIRNSRDSTVADHECSCLDAVSGTPIVQASDIEGLPVAWLQVFSVPQSIAGSLNAIGICTLQDSLGISERDMIDRFGLQLGTLRNIARLWLLRRYSHEAMQEKHDRVRGACTGWETVWEEFLGSVARTPRDRRIVEGRLGVLDGHKWTLEELGDAEGITRERVRQVAKRSMRRTEGHQCHAVLKPLWDAMEHMMRRSGGACTSTEVATGLRDCFAWTSMPKPQHVTAISGIGDTFEVIESDGEGIIALRRPHPCLQCSEAQLGIGELVAGAENGITAAEAAEGLTRRCTPLCPLGRLRDIRFSTGYILRLASQTAGVRTEGTNLYTDAAWALRFGGVLEAIDAALLAAGRAVHFADLARDLQRLGRNMPERNVHACLSSRSDVALLWDRGTYIHQHYVDPPLGLIRTVEADAIERLKEGVPVLSANGLFQRYQPRLQRDGVPTDRALYSCLKISGNPRLAYTRYPYIMLAENAAKRPTVFAVLEDFVRDHEEGISAAEIEDYLVSDLGVSDQLKHNYIYNVPNVIQVDTGVHMHLDNLSVDAVRFCSIRDYVDQLLANVEQLSVDKVFSEKRVTCNVLGISTPVMLYSLLQVYCNDRYWLPRYPIIARDDATGEIGVYAHIEDYLREANAPCSTDQLHTYFVEELGFKPGAVHNAKYCEGVIQYAYGTVVHVDALEWTAEKQGRVEVIALDHLHEQLLLNRPYGLIDHVSESRLLPPLPSCAPWTPTVLGELLCSAGNFRIIGTARNAFVQIPNDDGIEDLQGLVCTLLDNEFGGAANLEEFEAYLRDAGVLQRVLKPGMLGDGSLVKIVGDAVVLAGLKP